MLNGTMCAVTRVICVIMEMNQTETGIVVPDAIKAWMPESKHNDFFKCPDHSLNLTFNFAEWRDEIPFVNAAPIDEAETKKAKKQKEGMKKK